MEKDKVQNDKVLPDDEISNEDLDKVAGGHILGHEDRGMMEGVQARDPKSALQQVAKTR